MRIKVRIVLSKIILKFLKLFKKTISCLKCILWNIHPDINVSYNTSISFTADIQLTSDGHALGGKVHVADNVTLSDGVIVAPYGGSVTLDENVFVGPYSVLYGHGGLSIGRNTLIAGHCLIIPSNHNFQQIESPIKDQDATNLGIYIGEDVWLGAGVRVLDGVTIGKGCIIGAGAVVTKSLPNYSIAVGVPATVQRYRDRIENYKE